LDRISESLNERARLRDTQLDLCVSNDLIVGNGLVTERQARNVSVWMHIPNFYIDMVRVYARCHLNEALPIGNVIAFDHRLVSWCLVLLVVDVGKWCFRKAEPFERVAYQGIDSNA
jgi:hypothetical protein